MVGVMSKDEASSTVQSNFKPWDLKDDNAFDQWEMAMQRRFRSKVPKGFMKSRRPTREDVEASRAGGKRPRGMSVDAELQSQQELWEEYMHPSVCKKNRVWSVSINGGPAISPAINIIIITKSVLRVVGFSCFEIRHLVVWIWKMVRTVAKGSQCPTENI